ncbi:HVA22 A, putative isoform 3 [Theobroma cacao]|uniref:HVA22 A, putative isoform 3 n=1 Tax=Theobroma cacao TaxID=3641 RepID=A0A061E100_THECC|nr:HVA22 A, putative isoform 3 [Theobroma cacao]
MGLLQWLPFWPYMKLTLVGWLMIPRFDGALYVYDNFVHPCLYVDMQTIINWFRKQQEFFLNDNFLAEADKYVKANGPEALEKLIPTESKDREPSTLQKEIKPVRVAEVKETAAVNLIPETEPSAAQTQVKMLAVARPEIKEATGWDLPELPSDKQVQKEWTCAMCQVTTSSEKNLNMHLQGRRHRAACEGLMKAKNQPSKGKVAPASAVKDSKKEPEKRASSSSTQASPKMQQPSNGQVSAASVGKNSDLLKNEPEKCATSNGTPTSSKAVNPKTGISNGSKPDLPKEEPKNSLPKNKAGNQQKSREKVQGQQQSGKKHAKVNNPQFRCTICNISCGRSEDLNCHLWGRKHLARIQELNRLGQSELA